MHHPEEVHNTGGYLGSDQQTTQLGRYKYCTRMEDEYRMKTAMVKAEPRLKGKKQKDLERH